MKIKSLIKYLLRFSLLLFVISYTTIWYFDKFTFINDEHKFEIYLNIVEDYERFYNFFPLSWITIDALFFIITFLFLILLYTTKFYTYVNELDFSYDNRYLDDYVLLYLMWNSYFFSMLYLFRIDGLSRSYLVLYSFTIPFILLLFRNGEIISNLLGRSVSNENYLSFNLESDSNFKNLRILAYRNEKLAIKDNAENIENTVVREVNNLNKSININLVVLNISNLKRLPIGLEEYLINLNKKVLIISTNELVFHTNFIYRFSKIDTKYLYYFNNDVQYGSKYILKRLFDISISLLLLLLLSPLFLVLYFYVKIVDKGPSFVSQTRVGLHGKKFKMFKFRTMYVNAHSRRGELENDNQKSGPLFKINQDPRIIKNLQFLRNYSLDELPQLLNVIKGEMSLVGPRPLFEDDTNTFDKNYMRRLNVMPGMTGLLQINERDTDDFDIWYKYDIEYIENWTLYLDFKILLKTFKAVIEKSNAGK
jgi:lipopolysaccharide/colanic/teichoic acid biosynthesis glycosyltransferase